MELEWETSLNFLLDWELVSGTSLNVSYFSEFSEVFGSVRHVSFVISFEDEERSDFSTLGKSEMVVLPDGLVVVGPKIQHVVYK